MKGNFFTVTLQHEIPLGESCKYPDREGHDPYACRQLDSYDNKCLLFNMPIEFERSKHVNDVLKEGRSWLKCSECLEKVEEYLEGGAKLAT